MPGRRIRTSNGLLGSVLIVMGIGYAAIGAGWITTPTSYRLAGVEWLGVAGSDVIIGAAWVTIGFTVALCGVVSKKRAAETTGTLLAIAWPILVGALFFIAWSTGESSTGWITTISYGIYAGVVTTVASWPRPAEQIVERRLTSEGPDA